MSALNKPGGAMPLVEVAGYAVAVATAAEFTAAIEATVVVVSVPLLESIICRKLVGVRKEVAGWCTSWCGSEWRGGPGMLIPLGHVCAGGTPCVRAFPLFPFGTVRRDQVVGARRVRAVEVGVRWQD